MTTQELTRPADEPATRHVRVDLVVAVAVLAVLVVGRLASTLA